MDTSHSAPRRRRGDRHAPLTVLGRLGIVLLLAGCASPGSAPAEPTRAAVARPTSAATVAPTAVPTALRPSPSPTSPEFSGPYADEFAEALPLTIGEQLEETFSGSRNGDWFSFEPQAGRFYQFATELIDNEFDTILTLYDAEGRELAVNDDAGSGFGSAVYYDASDNQPVFLQVTSYNDGARGLRYAMVAMRLTIGEPDAYEDDNRRDVAPKIDLDEDQQRSLHSPIDEDWVEFDAESGRLYHVTAVAENDLLNLTLFDEEDSQLNVTVNELYFMSERDETYAIRIQHDSNSERGQVDYTLLIELSEDVDVDDFEVDDSAADARELEIDVEQRHSFHNPLDRDWIKVELNAGDNISIMTRDLSPGLDTLMMLFAEDGTQLDYNDDAGHEPRASMITYYATEATTVYAEISPFSPPPPGETYRLIAVREAAPTIDTYEPDDGENDAGPIAIGEQQEHTFHRADDVDWVRLEVEAGTAYQLATAFLSGDLDTVLTLYDDRGNELMMNDDIGASRASRVVYVAQESATLYAEIRAYGGATPGAGYTLGLFVVEAATLDDYEPDDTATDATLIAVGEAQQHTFHLEGDIDWFAIDVEAGDEIVIATSDLDASLDTTLTIYDRDGAMLDSNDDLDAGTFASRITYRATSDTTIYIEVAAISDVAAGAAYTLSVRAP